MSPILTVQRNFRELGRIRMGHQATKNGKAYPAKLDSFRLTSASKALLDAAARVYGGAPREWAGAPNEGTYELFTETDALDILVPPGQAISQWFEMWSAGGCQRRCDGITEHLGETDCLCPSDVEERRDLAADGKACHMVTRLNVILPKVPDIGVWRLESRGYYSATEIPGTLAIFERATAAGMMVPARLRIDHRTAKRPGKPVSRYIVPVLELAATLGELGNGEVGEHRLSAPETKALPASPSTKAEAPAGADAPTRAAPAPPLPAKAAATPETGEGSGRAAASQDDPLTPAQMRKLAVLAKKLGLDDAVRKSESGGSFKDLTKAGASRLIDEWEMRLAGRPTGDDEW